MNTDPRRDVFLKILDNVRARYQFLLVGYVVMPEHIHLLVSEPKMGTPSTVMQVLKQRVARTLGRGLGEMQNRGFWERRFYDFNVWSHKKKIEKLEYMHANPVKRGLVTDPKLWAWSSYRFYQYGENGLCDPDREPTA